MLNQDKVRISVKGDEAAVRAELARRGIEAELVEVSKKVGGQCQSFWNASADSVPALVSWYCEPAVCAEGTGFPDGTLLFYR